MQNDPIHELDDDQLDLIAGGDDRGALVDPNG